MENVRDEINNNFYFSTMSKSITVTHSLLIYIVDYILFIINIVSYNMTIKLNHSWFFIWFRFFLYFEVC